MVNEMKRNYKRNLWRVLIALMLTVSSLNFNTFFVQAEEIVESDNEDFTISNGVLTAYSGSDSVVTIPDGVTEIKNSVFERNSTITKVILPEGLMVIGNCAFADCTSLAEVVIPETVTSIGVYAFGNTALKEVVLPSNLAALKNNAFENSSVLENVFIPASLTDVGYYGIFAGCPNLKTVTFEKGITAIPENVLAESSITEIVIPETVTSIGNNAFRSCAQLENIEIPNEVTGIGYGAFENCSQLSEVKLSETLTTIGNRAFADCPSLGEIVFPETLTSIGVYGFGNTGLKEVVLPSNLTTLGNNVFENSSVLESVFIPASLTSVGYYGIFADSPNLKSVIFEEGITAIPENILAESSITEIAIPETVTSIGNNAFRSCMQLENIEIPNEVTGIGYGAFENCSQLSEVKLSEKLTTIGNRAFAGCTSLGEITFPETLTSIGVCGLGNTGLKEVVLPSNLTTLGNNVFENSSVLESVFIPASLTDVGYYGVFANSPNLKTVIFEEGISSIPDDLFAESSLESIVIPDTVTSIGSYAFRDCKMLEEVLIPETVRSIGGYTFSNCEKLGNITLPQNLETIGNLAFSNCVRLTEVELPSTLTSIGNEAFSNTSLREVILPENLNSLGANAYENCQNLSSVHIPASLTDVGYYGVFAGCPNLKTVTFEEGISSIPDDLFAESALETLVIPDTVTSIGNYAFRDNQSLVSVNIGKNVIEIDKNTFQNCPNVVIYCYTGSTAANYAVENNIAYELLDGHEHKFSEWKILRKETCTYEGKKQRSCLCGATAYETIPELGHAYHEYWTVDSDPTCTRDGQSSRHCDRCDYRIDIQTKKSQGHVYGEWITLTEPDYEHAGSQKKVCSVCKDAVTEEIPKLVINWEELSGYGLVKVKVLDGMSGNALSGAEVSFILSETEIYTATTNEEGYAQRLIPTGDYKVQAYKSGYTTRTVMQNVVEGEQMMADLAISSQSVIGGDLTVTEMTLEEIRAAGIDTSDPDNQHVYKYEIKLRFEEGYEILELPITTLKNGNGGFLGFWFGGLGGTGGGSGDSGGSEYSFTLGDSKYRICVVNESFYIVLHGEAKWLKEMFAVDLIVANNSAVDDFNNCRATLDIPYGVSLAAMRGADQKETIEIGTVEKGTTRNVSWYIRGDLEGDYHLSALLEGTMSSYGDTFSYEYKTKSPFRVYAGSALHLSVIISDAAYFNEPYTIILELENVSDKTLYNVEHKVNDVEQYSVKEYTWLEDGKVVDYEEEWDLLDKSQLGDSAMVSKKEFKPGEKLVVKVETTVLWESSLQKTKTNSDRVSRLLEVSGLANIPEGKVMQIILDLISYMDVRYYLTDAMISTMEGSTTTIPTDFVIEHKPGITLKDKLTEILGDELKDKAVEFLTGDDEDFQNAITLYEGLKEDLEISSATADTKAKVWVENADGNQPVISVNAGTRSRSADDVIEFTGSREISVTALNSGKAYLVIQDDEGNIYRKLYTVKKAGPGVAENIENYAALLENEDIIIEPEKEITASYMEYLETLNFVILDDQLQELGEGQRIPTGAIIKDKDTGEQKMFVVNGDTDSDAEINIFDGDRIMQMLEGLTEMTEAQKAAAETTGNEELTVEDILEIFCYLMEDEDAVTYSLRRTSGETLTVTLEDLGLADYAVKGLQVDIQNDSEKIALTGMQPLTAGESFQMAGHIEDEMWRALIYSCENALETDEVFSVSYVPAEGTKTVSLPMRVMAVTDQGNVELDVELTLSPTGEVVKNEVTRISGASRYDTALKTADALKEALGIEKFEAVVVATGKNFADALAGSYLAVEKNAPILLTNGKEDNIASLHAYIKENVSEGGTVYILGGEGAVPKAAENVSGYEVVRVFGDSRYDTNLAILKEAGVNGDSIIVATGKAFADSLSASASKLPILLVKPNGTLNDDQKTFLEDVKTIYIVGGEGAVSAAYEEELAEYAQVERVFGNSRYETSVAVADTFFGNVNEAVVASGKNFPDGLCGGPLAAAMNAPLLLTADGKTDAAAAYTEDKGIQAGFVLGGDGALSDDTVVNVFGLEGVNMIIKK